MKYFRVTSVGVLAFAVLVFIAANSQAQQAQQRPPIFEKVAKTCGLDSWDKVDAIQHSQPANRCGPLSTSPAIGLTRVRSGK